MLKSWSARAIMAIALMVVLADTARAQICAGSAPFSSGVMRMAGAMAFGDQLQSYSGNLAISLYQNVWFSGVAGVIDFDEFQNSSTVVGLTGGYSFAVKPNDKFEMCPLASYSYQSGPSSPSSIGHVKLSEHIFGFGGSVGGLLVQRPGVGVVPFVSGQWTFTSTQTHVTTVRHTESDDFFVMDVGIGFVVHHNVTLRPAASFPLGLEGAKASYGVAIGVNF